MHERAGEVNQSFVETVVRPFAIRQPEFFKHLVRLVIKPAIEALEVAEVMGVVRPTVEALDQRRDLRALLAHRGTIAAEFARPKPKEDRRAVNPPAVAA